MQIGSTDFCQNDTFHYSLSDYNDLNLVNESSKNKGLDKTSYFQRAEPI